VNAFPNPNNTEQAGMSLRDYFAGQALAGILAHTQTKTNGFAICRASYQLADEMMKARDEDNKQV